MSHDTFRKENDDSSLTSNNSKEEPSSEPHRRKIGRPPGRRNSTNNPALSSLRRRFVFDGSESLTYFKTLTKEDLLTKFRNLPPDLELYDICRQPRTLNPESLNAILQQRVRLSDTGLTEDLSCPICMGTYQNVAVVKNCLHRFCEGCIEKWLRTGHQDCPKCRQRIPSRRSLRADPIFQRIVQRLFPNVQEFERYNDCAVASANRRRVGLTEDLKKDIQDHHPNSATQGAPPGLVLDVAKSLCPSVVQLQVMSESVDLKPLETLKIKPLTVLTIHHVVRMIKTTAEPLIDNIATKNLVLAVKENDNTLTELSETSRLNSLINFVTYKDTEPVLVLHVWSKDNN